jgi:hypothetical protein
MTKRMAVACQDSQMPRWFSPCAVTVHAFIVRNAVLSDLTTDWLHVSTVNQFGVSVAVAQAPGNVL